MTLVSKNVIHVRFCYVLAVVVPTQRWQRQTAANAGEVSDLARPSVSFGLCNVYRRGVCNIHGRWVMSSVKKNGENDTDSFGTRILHYILLMCFLFLFSFLGIFLFVIVVVVVVFAAMFCFCSIVRISVLRIMHSLSHPFYAGSIASSNFSTQS